MYRFRALLLLLLVAFVATLPVSAHAADLNLPILNPDFQIVPDANALDPDCLANAPLGFAGFLQLVQNLMNASVSVGLLVITLTIAYAGAILMLSPTNPENKSKAKSMISNAIIGFIIVLAAWLIVDFVMTTLYVGQDGESKTFGPWNAVLTGGDYCIVASTNQPLYNGVSAPGQGGIAVTGGGAKPRGGSTTSSSSAGGSCTVKNTGNCSASALAPYFGTAANQASQICYKESKGNIINVSTSDYMRNDPQKRAFSFGLFQINLTYHEVAGLNCPAAFSGKNYTARVKNEALYAQCVSAAKDAEKNIAEAVATYKRTGWREWSTAKDCGLASENLRSRLMGAVSSFL
ncbi:MAG: hypothetical protein JWN64_296 [Parcubacteria group bacterium]|nr:hypothetical protein [Parcubacteria group bacterium]